MRLAPDRTPLAGRRYCPAVLRTLVFFALPRKAMGEGAFLLN